jgi:hypothetical protein
MDAYHRGRHGADSRQDAIQAVLQHAAAGADFELS